MRIGALARMSDVAADMEVRRRFPVIAEALLFAASGQLRNMASIGGNIMQRTRCAYFRDETMAACNKRRPGSGCAALHGLNRNHAIFGWSECLRGDKPLRSCGRACSYGCARASCGEQRANDQIPFTDFHRLPGGAPERDNVLDRGDLIVAIEVPASVGGARLALPQGPRPRSPMSSRSFQPRPRSPQTAGASARRGLRWAASPTSRGGLRRLKPACAEFRWTTVDGLRSAIATSFVDARPLAHNAFKVELAQRVALRALQTAGARL